MELEIDGLAAGGRGVGRREGRVWFVVGGLPGDRVLVRPIRHRARFSEGRVVELLRPSELRRAAVCPVQGSCGGCPWMTLPEQDQHDWKRRIVEDALRRIAGLDGVLVEEVRELPASLGYRHKTEFSLGRDPAGQPVIGFHAAGADRLIDVTRCAVQHGTADAVLATVRDYLLARGPERQLRFRKHRPFRLMLRSGGAGSHVLVGILETSDSFPGIRAFAEHLAARHPEVSGVVRIRTRSGRRGGTVTEPVLGESWIRERIGGLDCRLPAGSFQQVNVRATEALIDEVLARVGTPSALRVLDLYGGVGTYGLPLAARGAEVTVCEADDQAVAFGEANARRNAIAGVRFVRSDVGRFLAEFGAADVVLANPPRGGLGRGVAAAILARRPRKVVLVSCEPSTLARDLAILTDGELTPDAVVPFDFFPQTAHVEVLASLSR